MMNSERGRNTAILILAALAAVAWFMANAWATSIENDFDDYDRITASAPQQQVAATGMVKDAAVAQVRLLGVGIAGMAVVGVIVLSSAKKRDALMFELISAVQAPSGPAVDSDPSTGV